MNQPTRLLRSIALLFVTCAVMLVAGATSAFALTPTASPLSGSNFQGADGNQDTPAPPAGLVDWDTATGTLGGTDDPGLGGDIAFAGGNKETEPINWDTQNEGTGVNPNKDNILAAWSQSSAGVNGDPSTFLNLAFTREASTGNTYATFELNQDGSTWNNGHMDISCRKTNDLLISYNVASGGTPPNVDIVVYKWTTLTVDPAVPTSGCGATGTLDPLDPQPFAQGAMNKAAIPNWLSGTLPPPMLKAGTFGEASLNLTGILNKLEIGPCEHFSTATMHTRSSTSIDSQLQDLAGTVPVPINPCKLKIDKQVSVGDTDHFGNGPAVGYVGQTAYYKLIVTNSGSQPLQVTTVDVGPTCGGDLYTTATPGPDDHPVSMPQPIAAHAIATYYCSHVLTADDASANGGDYVNKACTSGTNSTTFGTPPNQHTETFTATGDPDAAALCDTVTVNVHDPHMSVVKTQALDATGDNWTGADKSAHVGDTIYYKVVATNTGNTPIDLTADDVNCGNGDSAGTLYTSIDQQAPASFPVRLESNGDTATFYCKHTLTAGDAAANEGDYDNQACVEAVDTADPPANATDADGATRSCDTVTTHIVISGLKIVKEVSASGRADDFSKSIELQPGDTAHYRVTITNTGTLNADLTSVTPKELVAVCDAGTIKLPDGFEGNLAQGASIVVTCEHLVTAQDSSPIDNTACVRGTDMTGSVLGEGDSICSSARVTIPFVPASVSGTKFHDTNANGTRDGGEGGLSGWTFYVDYNGNGSLDSGEPSAVSGADGAYKISGIQGGTFAVREVGQTGWTCSAPGTCEYDLTFASRDAKTGADFGNWEPASVAGTKFQDTNGNGQRDAGEGPLAGFTFYVDYNGNGALDTGEPAAVSAADGGYVITGVKPGTFSVLEVADPNFTCTAPGSGSACGYQVTLNAGDAQTGKDFGNQPPAQLVLPSRIVPGTAKLLGPTGCTSKAFNASIRGTKVQTVTFILDGKTIKRFTKTNAKGVYAVRINPASLRLGVHRLVASVTFAKGSGTKPKTLRLSFQRCAKKLISPRFTG